MKCLIHYFTHWAKLSIVRRSFSWLQEKKNQDPSEEGTEQSGSVRQQWIPESPRLEKTLRTESCNEAAVCKGIPQECVIHKPRHTWIQLSHSGLRNCNGFICVRTPRRDFCISSQRLGLNPIELGKKKSNMWRNIWVIFREIKLPCLPVPSILLKPSITPRCWTERSISSFPILHYRALSKVWSGCSVSKRNMCSKDPFSRSHHALSLQQWSSGQGKSTCEGAPSISEQETPSHGKETPEEPGEDCYIKCVGKIRWGRKKYWISRCSSTLWHQRSHRAENSSFRDTWSLNYNPSSSAQFWDEVKFLPTKSHRRWEQFHALI